MADVDFTGSAGMKRALTAAAVAMAATGARRGDCNPTDRINAQCYPDLQTATAAPLQVTVIARWPVAVASMTAPSAMI
jgi:hypothetical protein